MDKRKEILIKNILFLNENRIVMNKNQLYMMDRLQRIGVAGIEKENQFNVVAEFAATIRKVLDKNTLNVNVHPPTPCKLCGKPIRWLRTKRGKSACIDAQPYNGEELYDKIKHNYHFTFCTGKKER